MADERIRVILDVDAEVSKARGNINNLTKVFDNIGGTKGGQLREILSQIGTEYDKLAEQSGKAMGKVGDFSKAEKSSEKLNSLFKKLGSELNNIGKSSSKELEKLFPAEVANRIQKANEAIKIYNSSMKKSEAGKGAINQATQAYQKQIETVNKLEQEVRQLEEAKKGGTPVNATTRDAQKQRTKEAEKIYTAQLAKANAAEKARDDYAVQQGLTDKTRMKSSTYRDKNKTYNEEIKRAEELRIAFEQAKAALDKMYVPETVDKEINDIKTRLEEAKNKATEFKDNLSNVKTTEINKALDEAKKKLQDLTGIDLSQIGNIDDLNNLLQRFTVEGVDGLKKGLQDAGIQVKELGTTNDQVGAKIENCTNDIKNQNAALEDINGLKSRIQYFFSLTNTVMLARRAIQQTFETVKELDAAMTETAVVTDFNVGDMWDQLPRYTAAANELGTTTLGAYETMTLFYQQGLETNEVFEIGTETMKMARIAGLDYAEATDLMTAALRGFNMELNESSATRINDVYSELAAITAADTNEIATAMTKTASIAANANMEFETTAALLSQIIETTREPAETAGTAMKTIIARFTEMKKATSDIINVDGEEVSVNKVEAALKSAGVALRDVNGEFRDLDDVFLELSSKWNGLDKMTQRYVATMAAGSRQQSRFIAMMQDYDRTMELVDAAYNSAGASQIQFGKTQESLESKLNRLENSWNNFLMGLSNSDVIKGAIDALTGLLDILNKGTEGISNFSTFISRLFIVIGGLKLGKNIFNNLLSSVGTQMGIGGQKAGQQFNSGVSATLGKGFHLTDFSKKITNSIETKSLNKKVSGIFKDISQNISENGEISGREFSEKLATSLSTEQLKASANTIGTTMESAIGAQLQSNNLTDEGQIWARSLIDGYINTIRTTGDISKANKELEYRIGQDLTSSNSSQYFKNGETGVTQARKNLKVRGVYAGKKKVGHTDANIPINEDTVKNSGRLKDNLLGAGMAMSALGMAGNMLASALDESGTASDAVVDNISSLSSGLTTAGSLMMALKSAQQMFNITTAANPYIAFAAVIIGAITAIAGAIGAANERQKELNNSAVDFAKEQGEKVRENEELINSYNELLDTYNSTKVESEELQAAKAELIETLELEKYGVNALTSSYDEVAAAAQKARIEMLETNKVDQQAGLTGAMSNALTEGKKPGWGGAGWINNGTGFEIDQGGSDNTTELLSLIKEYAKNEGLEGLNFNTNNNGNLQIDGLSTSPEDQRIWMKIISQVLNEYRNTLTESGVDSSNAWAYNALSSFWGNVGTYYTEGSEISSNMDETEYLLAEDFAKNLNIEVTDSIQSFHAGIQEIISSLSDFNLTDEQKTAIANNVLTSDDSQLKAYGQAYTQILKLANNSAENDFTDFINGLNNTDIRLLANLDVVIDEDSTTNEIKKALTEVNVIDNLFGSTDRMANLTSFSEKLLAGEIEEEDINNMTSYIAQDFGPAEQREWELVQDEGVSTQLAYLQDLVDKKKEEGNAARQVYIKAFNDEIVNDLKYFDGTGDASGNIYQNDQKRITDYNKIIEGINIDTKNGGKISNATLKLLESYTKTYNKEGKDYYGKWNAYQHAIDYNKQIDNKNNNYIVYSKEEVATSKTKSDIKNAPDNGFFSSKGFLYGAAKIITGIAAEIYDSDSETYDVTTTANADAKKQAAEDATIALGEILKDLNLSVGGTGIYGAQDRVNNAENTLAYIMYQLGIDSASISQDRNKDGTKDFYDIQKLVNELDSAFTVLTDDFSKIKTNQVFDENGQIKTDLTGVTDQNTIDWVNKLQELEKKGIKITPTIEDGEIKTATIELERFDEEGNKIENDPIKIEVDNTALNGIAEQINDLDGSLITIETQIKQADAFAAKSSFELAEAQAQNLANALQLINSDLTVSPENAKQLQQIFPQLLEGATAVGNKIKLNGTTYNAVTKEVRDNLSEANIDYQNSADTLVQTTQQQATAFANVYNAAISSSADAKTQVTDDTKAMAKEYVKAAMEKERQAQAEAQTTVKLTNLGIDSAEATTIATISGLSQINEAIIAVTQNYVNMWKAGRGEEITPETMASVTSEVNKAAFEDFVDTTQWVTEDDVLGYLDNYNQETGNLNSDWASKITDKDKEGEEGYGSNEDEIAEIKEWADVVYANAQEDKDGTQEEIDAVIADAQTAELLKQILAGGQADADDKGGNKDSLNTEKESDKLKAKINEIDSAIKDLADNDIVDMKMVNELINQKIALQKQYKKALEQELGLLSKSTDEIWSQVKKAGNDKYIQYDEETGMYRYTDAYYAEFYEDGLPIDSEQMQKIQEQANQLNKVNSDQLANQVAIKELVDNLVKNQAENYNAERALKGRERRQTEADQEEELIGMLPEEIQPFFQALNTAEDAYLEMQEIQANKVLAENLQQQLDASYASVPDYIKNYMTFDEYSGYGINLAKINQIEDQQVREDMMTAVQKNAEVLNTMYDEWYDVKEQLSGGKLQRAILNTGKSLQELAKEISDGDIDTGLKKINTGFKALDDALNSFIKNLEDNEAIENILSTKVLPSLNLDEEQATKLVSNPKLQKALQGNVPLQNFILQAIGTEGIDLGAILGAAFGQTGGLLEQIGGFLNFDMMKILGDGGGLIEQGKQMVEQIVGKIAEITGALIDAWTNREDILYNFLNVLEKYLHDYEVMQRYSTQLEKGRMASVDDIRQNWEQQWQSLQDQLEMQQERIETRQDQLDRSRWNPFQLISGWDPTSDSLYENRGVKMAFDLLISAIGMLPMGLGAFGSQLNQLYEDYDKRVQEAYEDRLAAEMAILDIEDERLELVKIGAEEATEFEQKVLDALVQKEQEQIEELSRLNDAITDANSKLISTLQKNLDQIRQDRENEKKEEELGEKERRLAYFRQNTSGANMMEIKKLEEELEEEHEDYTDTLIDQKISELEKQNEAAAEQRQQQIDLLQAQLDWSQKYGLYWDAIYGMLYTIDENGNAVLNPENFDLDGNIRENSQLAQMLGTFSDRLGMSVWSSVLDNEEAKRLGRYYGAFIGNNGVSGEWADYWALLNPGADDPDYATPMPEIPDGIWGVLYKIETSIGKYFGSSNMGLWNAGERLEVGLKNILGDVFNIEEWANATAKGFHREDVIGKNTLTLMNGWNKLTEGLLGITDFGNKTSQSLTNRVGYNRHQNNGDNNISNYFNIGTVGENISLDDMVDKVSSALREVFSTGTNIVHHGR